MDARDEQRELRRQIRFEESTHSSGPMDRISRIVRMLQAELRELKEMIRRRNEG